MKLPEGWPTEYEKFSTWWENQKSYMAASKFEYWECWQASALAAPTPPAQEDEPVYFVMDGYSNGWVRESKHVYDKTSEEDRWLLYLRPADDKLRKAAEDVVNFYDVVDSVNEERVIKKLRAALEGK